MGFDWDTLDITGFAHRTPRDRRDAHDREALGVQLGKAVDSCPHWFKIRIGNKLEGWGDWYGLAQGYPLEFIQAWVWGPEGEFTALPAPPHLWDEAERYGRMSSTLGPNTPTSRDRKPLEQRLSQGITLVNAGFYYDRAEFCVLYIDNYRTLQQHMDSMRTALGLD